MSKVCVISIDPSFANGASVINALKEKIDVTGVFEKKDSKGIWEMCDAKYGYENIPKADEYIILSAGTLQRVAKLISGKVKVVICDTRYRGSSRNEIDAIIKGLNAKVFCMPDLWHLCKLEKKVYYQPFNIDSVKIDKSKRITLCHSPYSNEKSKVKGTIEITKAFEEMKQKYKTKYRIIKEMQWIDCLKLKATSHIFVDQYIHGEYIGGIGKSGLEAMLLKCLTISSGKLVETDIPAPPVVWCNEKLGEVIEKYILDEKIRNETIEQQYKWAKKYTSFDYVASRLLS